MGKAKDAKKGEVKSVGLPKMPPVASYNRFTQKNTGNYAPRQFRVTQHKG